MFRGDIRTYSDAQAREVRRAIERGVDARSIPLCEFLYLPFMHSEHLADQLRCIEPSRALGHTESLKWPNTPTSSGGSALPHRNRSWAARPRPRSRPSRRRGFSALMTEA